MIIEITSSAREKIEKIAPNLLNEYKGREFSNDEEAKKILEKYPSVLEKYVVSLRLKKIKIGRNPSHIPNGLAFTIINGDIGSIKRKQKVYPNGIAKYLCLRPKYTKKSPSL